MISPVNHTNIKDSDMRAKIVVAEIRQSLIITLLITQVFAVSQAEFFIAVFPIIF